MVTEHQIVQVAVLPHQPARLQVRLIVHQMELLHQRAHLQEHPIAHPQERLIGRQPALLRQHVHQQELPTGLLLQHGPLHQTILLPCHQAVQEAVEATAEAAIVAVECGVEAAEAGEDNY